MFFSLESYWLTLLGDGSVGSTLVSFTAQEFTDFVGRKQIRDMKKKTNVFWWMFFHTPVFTCYNKKKTSAQGYMEINVSLIHIKWEQEGKCPASEKKGIHTYSKIFKSTKQGDLLICKCCTYRCFIKKIILHQNSPVSRCLCPRHDFLQ